MTSKKNLLLAVAMILVVASIFGSYTALSLINNVPTKAATPQGAGYVGLYVGHPVDTGQIGVNIIDPDSPDAEQAYK